MNDWIEVENKNHKGMVGSTKKDGKWVLIIYINIFLSKYSGNSDYRHRISIDIPSKNYQKTGIEYVPAGHQIIYNIDENRQGDFRKSEEFDVIIKVERKQNKTNH